MILKKIEKIDLGRMIKIFYIAKNEGSIFRGESGVNYMRRIPFLSIVSSAELCDDWPKKSLSAR